MRSINFLRVRHQATTTFRSRWPTQHLLIRHTARCANRSLQPQQLLRPLQQTATWSVDGERSVTHTLIFNQSAKHVYLVNTTSHLIFTQLTNNRPNYEKETILFVHDAQNIRSKGIRHRLRIIQHVRYTREPFFVQHLSITQHCSYYKPHPYFTILTPFFTGSSSLTYGSFTVNLPAPDFDDIDEITLYKINRRLMGNKLDFFRDDLWPKKRELTLRYSWLKRDKVEQIKQLIEQSLGRFVTLTWGAMSISVIILNPNTDYIEEKNNQYIVTLRFYFAF